MKIIRIIAVALFMLTATVSVNATVKNVAVITLVRQLPPPPPHPPRPRIVVHRRVVHHRVYHRRPRRVHINLPHIKLPPPPPHPPRP